MSHGGRSPDIAAATNDVDEQAQLLLQDGSGSGLASGARSQRSSLASVNSQSLVLAAPGEETVPPSLMTTMTPAESGGHNNNNINNNNKRVAAPRTTTTSNNNNAISGNTTKARGLKKEDIVAAASAATGVDLVAQHQRDQQQRATSAAARGGGAATSSATAQQQQKTATAASSGANNKKVGSAKKGASAASVGRGVATASSIAIEESVSMAFSPAAALADLKPSEPQLPGYEKRAARKQCVGMRLAAARISAGVSPHDLASRCGVPVAKLFAIEKGTDNDLEKWCRILAQVCICLGVPFSEVFGDYLPCTQNPHIVATGAAAAAAALAAAGSFSSYAASSVVAGGGSGSAGALAPASSSSIGMPSADSTSISFAASLRNEPPPWKLTVGGRLKHARERLKVASDVLCAVLVDELGVLESKDEYDDLEMCDSPAEDVIPVLLYVLYRSGACLASIVL